MLFQQGELTGQQLRVAEGAGLHDRSLDQRDDVAGQVAGIWPPRRAQRPYRCLQVGLELLRHLVETLGQTFAKTVVAIAEGRTQVADDAAPLAVLPATDQ